MPFSAELALDMDGKCPGNINYAANPELKGLTTGQVMDRWDWGGVGLESGPGSGWGREALSYVGGD
jgi:hypothetical protein